MGANVSRETPTQNVFQKELRGINDIVNKILNEDNTFKNREYNFLSQDICNKYQIVLENELSKHLKIQLAEFGTSIYVIPKEDNPPRVKMTKAQICERISNHYISILYVLSLVKYVYNIENNGDRSFGGIIFRNIKIVNNLMEVMFCDTDQKDFNDAKNPNRVNLSKLDGFKFFTQYFLSKEESKAFMKLMRSILGRKPKAIVRNAICECIQNKTISKSESDILNVLFLRNYGEAFRCAKSPAIEPDIYKLEKEEREREIDTTVFVTKGNPVFLRNFCNNIDNRVVDITTKEGKEVKRHYDIMMSSYRKNIDEVFSILSRLVVRSPTGEYNLIDIDGETLTNIINATKVAVRKFFFQSILDYQHLLDMVKNTPNVKLSIKTNVFD